MIEDYINAAIDKHFKEKSYQPIFSDMPKCQYYQIFASKSDHCIAVVGNAANFENDMGLGPVSFDYKGTFGRYTIYSADEPTGIVRNFLSR